MTGRSVLRARMSLAILFATVTSSGCPTPKRQEEAKVSDPTHAQSSVSVELVDLAAGPQHPESLWTFDLHLSNGGDEPRWFALLSTLGPSLGDVDRAAGVRLDALASDVGPVPVVRLISGYEVIAFRLPPKGRLTVRRLPTTCWDEEGAVMIEVWALEAFLVEGEPLEASWLRGRALTAPAKAVVAEFGTPEPTYKLLDPELDDTPVKLEPTQRWKLPIDRGARELPWEGAPLDWDGDGSGPPP